MKAKEKYLIILFLINMMMLIDCKTLSANDFVHSFSSDSDVASTRNYKRKRNKKRAVAEVEESKTTEVKEKTPEIKSAPLLEEVNNDNYGQLHFAIMPSFMSVEGTQVQNNSIGLLNSNMYASYELDYKHVYHNWSFGASIGFGKIKFEHSDDHILTNGVQSLFDLDLYASRRFGRFSIGAGIGQDNKIFYKALNSTYVDIEKRTVQRIYLQSEYEFIKGRNNSGSVSVRAGINPAADSETYDVEGGATYGAQIKWDHFYAPNKTIGMQFYYNNDAYKTQKLKLKSSEIGFGVSFSYDWGSGR